MIAVALVFWFLHADEGVRNETRTSDAIRKFGVQGRGVAVAIIDRGLDWRNNDFRNADGSTRVDSIFDMTDNAGANAPGNSFRTGTIYTRAQIDAALKGGAPLAHRDAVGHGTTTTGIAAGNGANSRDGKYRGFAPKSTIVVVKMVAGAAAHDDQPAEANFAANNDTLPNAIDYAVSRARALNMPMVMLPNIGSVSGPMDGTSSLNRKIDSIFNANNPGLVFVNGSSDDGGQRNHAQTTVAQGQSVALQIDKADAGFVRFHMTYPEADRYDVTLQSPTAAFGPFVSPAANNATDSRSNPGVAYFHYGSAATPFGGVGKRMILVDLTGPAGRYVVTLRGATASGAAFHAWVNTIAGKAQFANFVAPGYTVWDGAAAKNNICPNDYTYRNKWADIDGLVRASRVDKIGDLWEGSGIGPTVDGRLGVDISAPGEKVFASLAPNSVYATSRANRVQDGNGFYTLQTAVSAASPQVTGIIALMLELNPRLDATQVKRILQETARRDAFTGPDPNPRWGYGKVDALAALTAASAMPGARPYYTVDRDEIAIDFQRGSENPAPVTVSVAPGNEAGDFTIETSASWLRAAAGEGPGTVVVTAVPDGLANGDYSGEVTIAGADGKAVPQTILVFLHVRQPGPLITSIVDAGAEGPGFANGGRILIRGFGLAGTTREWQDSDFTGDALPVALDGVRVRIFDRDAFPYFVSPTEIRAIAPDNPLTNTRFAIVTFLDGRAGNGLVANTLPRNPEFFRVNGGRYVDASLPDTGEAIGPERPALPGEAIAIRATGCGATNPPLPVDRLIKDTSAPVSDSTTLTIGGKSAQVSFAGTVGNGVCQVNAIVPDVAAGDAEVLLKIGNFTSADAVLLPVGAK